MLKIILVVTHHAWHHICYVCWKFAASEEHIQRAAAEHAEEYITWLLFVRRPAANFVKHCQT